MNLSSSFFKKKALITFYGSWSTLWPILNKNRNYLSLENLRAFKLFHLELPTINLLKKHQVIEFQDPVFYLKCYSAAIWGVSFVSGWPTDKSNHQRSDQINIDHLDEHNKWTSQMQKISVVWICQVGWFLRHCSAGVGAFCTLSCPLSLFVEGLLGMLRQLFAIVRNVIDVTSMITSLL